MVDNDASYKNVRTKQPLVKGEGHSEEVPFSVFTCSRETFMNLLKFQPLKCSLT